MPKDEICRNLDAVNETIERACKKAGRQADEITLVAVSKTKPVEMIRRALHCGQVHFGENKVQELVPKMEETGDSDIIWHMVGTLQTNKIKYLVDRVNWIDSIPKIKALRELEKRASQTGRIINTLIQVNISHEDQKSGCRPEDLRKLLEYAGELKSVKVRGLMGIATLTEDPEEVRPEFQKLAHLAESHQDLQNEAVRLDHLSMGMTHDMEVAIEEGATMVRVGQAIFGARE